MNFLIVYSSKTGTARDCAFMLKDCLKGHSVTLCDLNTEFISPENFDAVVVGGYIRFGKPSKKLRKYLKFYHDALVNTKTAYFTVCAFPDRSDEYFEDMLTDSQRRSAFITVNFGGTLKVERQKNIFSKALVRTMRNEITENGDSDDPSFVRILPEIIPSEISKLADIITGRNV